MGRVTRQYWAIYYPVKIKIPAAAEKKELNTVPFIFRIIE